MRLNNPGKSRGYRFRLCSMFLLNLYIKLQPLSKLLDQQGAVARQIEASFLPLPPGAVLTLYNQVFNST